MAHAKVTRLVGNLQTSLSTERNMLMGCVPCLCLGRFPNKAHSPKQIFMQSLICKVQPAAQLLRCTQGSQSGHSKGRHSTSAPHRSAAACQPSIGPSPCPRLDAFIASVCNQVGIDWHSSNSIAGQCSKMDAKRGQCCNCILVQTC